MRVRKLLISLVGIFWIVAVPALATVFSTVKGVVHDPQHRPVPGATVTVKARQADADSWDAVDSPQRAGV